MSAHFLLGGARSGKSALAQRLAEESALPVTVIVTGEPRDAEMAERIARHRRERPAHWRTVEAPFALADALRAHAAPGRFVLVDCLTLWLSNMLFAGAAAQQAEAGQPVDCPLFSGEVAALVETLPQLPGRVIMVSNEVGWGIVPMARVSRLFADEQGRLNQRVAAVCDAVTLVAAGLPVKLK